MISLRYGIFASSSTMGPWLAPPVKNTDTAAPTTWVCQPSTEPALLPVLRWNDFEDYAAFQ